MRYCSATRFGFFVPLAVILLGFLAACGQAPVQFPFEVQRTVGAHPADLKYRHDMHVCAALEVAHFPVSVPVSRADSPDDVSSVQDIRRLKQNSYRKTCMASRGWEISVPEDVSRSTSVASWTWGGLGVGESCKSHRQCAENLFCRGDVCSAFQSTHWGGMNEGDVCSAYFDCRVGLQCRKEVCKPPATEVVRSPSMPGSRRSGDRCTEHAQCGTGLLCREDICRPATSTGFELSLVPMTRRPGAACTAHYQCANDLLCDAAVCQ